MRRIDGEDEDYRIWVGGYSGNASDSLSAHNGYKFSTVDRNNDLAPKCCPCAPAYGGGWWFYRWRTFSDYSVDVSRICHVKYLNHGYRIVPLLGLFEFNFY